MMARVHPWEMDQKSAKVSESLEPKEFHLFVEKQYDAQTDVFLKH